MNMLSNIYVLNYNNMCMLLYILLIFVKISYYTLS